MREDFHCLLSCVITLCDLHVLETSVTSSVLASTCTPSYQHKFSRVCIDPGASASLQEDHRELLSNRHSEMVKMEENIPSALHFIKTIIIYNKQRDWLQDVDPHLALSSLCSCSRTVSQQGWQDELPQIPRAELIFTDNAKNYGTRKSTSWKAMLAAAL